MSKLTNHFQWSRVNTINWVKHCSLDSEGDFFSECRNVSHQQQFFSNLPSPGQSHNMKVKEHFVKQMPFFFLSALYAITKQTCWLILLWLLRVSAATSRAFNSPKNNSCTPYVPMFIHAWQTSRMVLSNSVVKHEVHFDFLDTRWISKQQNDLWYRRTPSSSQVKWKL